MMSIDLTTGVSYQGEFHFNMNQNDSYTAYFFMRIIENGEVIKMSVEATLTVDFPQIETMSQSYTLEGTIYTSADTSNGDTSKPTSVTDAISADEVLIVLKEPLQFVYNITISKFKIPLQAMHEGNYIFTLIR